VSDETLIEIPSDKLREAVKLAYAASAPQGLGFLHAREGGLSDEDANEIIEREKGTRFPNPVAASMDYVHGRSCKFTVFRGKEDAERLFIRPRWYDHSDTQLVELLEALGVGDPQGKIDAALEAQRIENERWERENAHPSPEQS
jgi:hypothetical protein